MTAGVWHVDPTRSIVDYAWVTPDYVLGTALMDPALSHIGPSNQNRWQGIIFATGARIYPQAAPTSVTKTQDAFICLQNKNVLIARKRGYATEPTLVYVPTALDVVEEQDGWLFVKEGNVYLAVRPATGTYAWLDPAKNRAAAQDNRFIKLSVVGSPIIFEATRIGSLSFADFKAQILANVLSYSGGVLSYTSRQGVTFKLFPDTRMPLVNGQPISYSPPDTFRSPYVQAKWGTGKVTIQKGALKASYDFSDPANPTKVIV